MQRAMTGTMAYILCSNYWYGAGGDTKKAIKYMREDMEMVLDSKRKYEATKKDNTIK